MCQVGVPFRHPALEPSPGVVLGELRLADHEVLALVLQVAGLLSHLVACGWKLTNGWGDARVDGDGLLRGVSIEPGVAAPQHGLLADLLLRGLGGVARVEGRGAPRRAARALLQRWHDPLLPLEPDHAIAEIFSAAPFLWEPSAASSRASLAVATAEGEVLCAGPPEVRLRLRRLGGLAEIAAALASEGARDLWFGAVEPERSPASDQLDQARQLWRSGKFELARAQSEQLSGDEARLLVARCRSQLGDQRGAREVLRDFEDRDLPPKLLLEVADVATRVLANLGERDLVQAWARRVVGEVPPAQLPFAHLIAALAAWDTDDSESMTSHLELARPLLESENAWRWYQACALEAMARGDGEAMETALVSALAARRSLGVVEAAALWNDLAVARVFRDDLPGAEKAQNHAIRLQRRLDGPRRTTVGLRNLAEIRLRRGRLDGVREILEASIARNRVDDQVRGLVQDWVLWSRYELLQGRPLAAVETLNSAAGLIDTKGIDWHRGELQVVLARALGWLGRAEEARDALTLTDPESRSLLGAEERPALFAHAGDLDQALAEAADIPQRRLWQALLTGAPPPRAWEAVDRLEPLRRARLIYDWEILSPGWVPAPRLRWAAAVLERGGAAPLSSFLEARVGGPWEALARFHEAERADASSIGELFAAAGWSHVRLLLESDGQDRLLVDGAGGRSRLCEELGDEGVLVLEAPHLDARLRCLVGAVVLRLRRGSRAAAVRRPVAAGPRSILGSSPALRGELDRLVRLARGELALLILGESGTGKELAARAAHEGSARASGPFLPVNCAALSETLLLSELFGHVRGSFTGADRDRAGVFEAARGGTVFLDEIGDLPPTAQGMLLRVLQEREIRRVGESLPRKVDVRVVAATHRDLAAMVSQGTFRQDLFYRLRVGVVTLPALRERGDDLVEIAEQILSRARPDLTFSRAALARLRAHSWPGNIRELENVVEAAAALAEGDLIEVEHLQLPTTAEGGLTGGDGFGYHERIQAYRRRLVEEALTACGGRQAEAARMLGMTRQSLSYLVRQLQLG